MAPVSEQAVVFVPGVDLSNCAREAIHIPGSIQPHGVLFVLDDEALTILQASENCDSLLGVEAASVLDQPLQRAVGPEAGEILGRQLRETSLQRRPVFLCTIITHVRDRDHMFNAVAHCSDSGIVLELELIENVDMAPVLTTTAVIDDFLQQAEEMSTVAELSRLAAGMIRRLTGFDRVLVYRFAPDWHGLVVGEDGNGRLPALLHHRFPESDIPAQARELYRMNRVRIIPDAGYQPVRVVPAENPATGRALDMSFSTLRSVSPVHLEYMRNMETQSSMSVSILRGGQLWGLISCHHREPWRVPFPVRTTCDLIARSFSLRLSALEQTDEYERRIEVRTAYSRLLAVMADRGDFAAALAEHPNEWLAFADAKGAAVLTDDRCLLVGTTPGEAAVRDLAAWLFREVRQDVYATDQLSAAFPPAQEYSETASGLLAIAVSKIHSSCVLWFRPEVVQTMEWGGNPRKPVETNGQYTRLHPRKSFETWKETVREKSTPWEASEIEGATELRNAIVGIVLRKAEELVELNAELTRSNKELEAFSYSVSHDLRAPLRHIVGYAEMLRESGVEKLGPRAERCISTIIESSEYAGHLVEKLLGYSRLGRAELSLIRIDMNELVREVRRDVMRDAEGRRVAWDIEDLPAVTADLMMLRMAVRDLLSNAVKYTRNRQEAEIVVRGRNEGTETVYSVKDNGVGFDMQYAEKLFGVFQRLHRWEDYEGTGIGLANVRRVIDRHDGRTWADGEVGVGATFYFSLPNRTDPKRSEPQRAE